MCVSARSGSQTVLDFTPTADFPSLQYFDVVEKNSQADLAGLRTGDFLLQVIIIIIIINSLSQYSEHYCFYSLTNSDSKSSVFYRQIVVVHVIS